MNHTCAITIYSQPQYLIMSFCSSCGKEMEASWNACPNCGAARNQRMPQEATTNAVPQVQQVVMMQQAPKSFGAALIFNFIWAGIGHMYLDDSRGLWMAIVGAITILSVVLIPVYLVIWIISLVQTRNVHNNYLIEKGFTGSPVPQSPAIS